MVRVGACILCSGEVSLRSGLGVGFGVGVKLGTLGSLRHFFGAGTMVVVE